MPQIHNEKIPLTTNSSGLTFIAESRVSLACLVEMFEEGASPEEMVEQYDVLKLADVYAVITYVLRNQDEVNAYMLRQNTGAEERYRAVDEKFPQTLRSKLLSGDRT